MLTGWLLPIKGRLRAEQSFQPTGLCNRTARSGTLPLLFKGEEPIWYERR